MKFGRHGARKGATESSSMQDLKEAQESSGKDKTENSGISARLNGDKTAAPQGIDDTQKSPARENSEEGASNVDTSQRAVSPRKRAGILIGCRALVIAIVAAVGIGSMGQQVQSVQTTDNQSESNDADSFTAHGSTYEKTETVAATSSLTGKVDTISVEEWIKNPHAKQTIEDESNLQQIASDSDDVTFTQKGNSVTWNTNGQDVHYTGVSDKNLPFEISYTYWLNGKRVNPIDLKM